MVASTVFLVVTQRRNRLSDKALSFALRLSPDVLAVHVTALEGGTDDDERSIPSRWAKDVEAPAARAGVKPPRLLLRADYRLIHDPLLRLIRELQKEFAGRIIAVLLPEVVKINWWQLLLHTRRARKLRSHLLRFGGSRLVIISVPWYLEEPRIEDGMEPPLEEGRPTPTRK